MDKAVYHGILIDAEFKDPEYPESFKIFARHKSRSMPWTLFGVEIPEHELDEFLPVIQEAMCEEQPYYLHFYNDKELIVVFKERVFKIEPHAASWEPVLAYGRSLNIPESQLDFWPNRFQDEIHYFAPEEFVDSN